MYCRLKAAGRQLEDHYTVQLMVPGSYRILREAEEVSLSGLNDITSLPLPILWLA